MYTRAIIRPAFIILTAITLTLSTGNGQPPAPPWQPAAADEPTVSRFTLSNGLKVVVDRIATVPVAEVSVVYLVGSADAPASDPGLNAAVAHMLSDHVEGLSASQLAALLSTLGGRSNSNWSTRTTRFNTEVASADIPIVLRLEADRMRGSGATNADWAVERAIFAQGAASSEGNYNVQWRRDMITALHPHSPLSQDQYSGVGALLRDPLSTAEKFRATWYVPSNAILIITGNVDPSTVESQVRADFDGLARVSSPRQSDDRLTTPHGSTTTIAHNLVTRPAFACFDEPGSASADYAAAQILDDIISSHTGELHALQENGKALTTSLDQLYGDRRVTVACAHAETGLVGSAAVNGSGLLDSLKGALAYYAGHGVTEDEVASAIHFESLQSSLDHTDPQTLASDWLVYVATLGFGSPGDYLAEISKVTPADVDRVAKACLDLHTLALATVHASANPKAPPAVAAPPAFTSIGSDVLPPWASSASTVPATIGSDEKAPAESTLPNGLRVITIDHPGTGVVQLYGRVKVSPPMATPVGKDGIDLVLARLFADGPDDMSHDAFAQSLDDLGGAISAGTDFRLSTTTDDFDRGLSLLADEELHPALSQQAVGLALYGALQDSLDRSMSLSSEIAAELAHGMFPPGDPSERQPNPMMISKITADDVRAYFGDAFRPERTTIVIIGDITPDKAVAEVSQWFGPWSDATTAAPPDDLPTVPESKAEHNFYSQRSLGVRWVLLGETLGVRPTSQNLEAVNAGLEVLGGDAWDSRFLQDIRAKQGLALNVSQTLDVEPNRSTINIFYICAPQNAAEVRSIIVTDIRSMQTVPLAQVALERAKARLIRRQLIDFGSPSTAAQQYLTYAGLGLPLNEPQLRAARYASLTPDDVMRALASYLRPDDFVDLEFGVQ